MNWHRNDSAVSVSSAHEVYRLEAEAQAREIATRTNFEEIEQGTSNLRSWLRDSNSTTDWAALGFDGNPREEHDDLTRLLDAYRTSATSSPLDSDVNDSRETAYLDAVCALREKYDYSS
ncbi:uncharacterized protein I303_105816 [Kwoniella dejecticola CBS 10117]|uniref:Uncharacterized protein n=1 Tax=Kwoniella dejecticola CBS 10117 TaxID=1296121 RepID=A0A1A6A0J5_9TREE|nr:uncharacterized protein I303_05838 [Kwoniella dejecticola CBS 10117]OBR83558.1 hypothetical protein I303_05838 [Kwoniella dejecticola CBS 10117]